MTYVEGGRIDHCERSFPGPATDQGHTVTPAPTTTVPSEANSQAERTLVRGRPQGCSPGAILTRDLENSNRLDVPSVRARHRSPCPATVTPPIVTNTPESPRSAGCCGLGRCRLESLRKAKLEAEGRFDLRRELQQRVCDGRQLLELAAAAQTGPDMAQHFGSPVTRQGAERHLGQVVSENFTLHRVFDVAAHWDSISSASRRRAIPKRIRPFAVPSGIASARAISVALRPYMAASNTARR